MNQADPKQSRKGRGAAFNPDVRFFRAVRRAFDDGWGQEDFPAAPLKTQVSLELARSIVTHNESPDLPFDQSINPYRGCEHGCIYCYARPAHAYADLSPGLDFESRLTAKPNAPALLRDYLARPGYRPAVIALGTNTDPYQPIERRQRITRGLLQVMVETRHPVSIVTKSALVERDLDLLTDLARDGLAEVHVSVTTLDRHLARRLEPRAAAPQRRLETIAALAQAGVPTGVMFAPVIPALNDHEMEAVLEAAASAGARNAGYVWLRLPREVAPLFIDWLEREAPLRKERILNQVRELRAGALNSSNFGERQQGLGPLAALFKARFALCQRRQGLSGLPVLDTHKFRSPGPSGVQLDMFA